MHDIVLLKGLGDALFQSLGFTKVLAKVGKDKSSETVRRQAVIAAMIHQALKPDAPVAQTAGLVLGVLFSEYSTFADATDEANHTTAIAWLRDYWANGRDPALSDVVVATASRVIRSRWTGDCIDLMDCVFADARLINTILSDRVDSLQRGVPVARPETMRARTVLGKSLLDSLQFEVERQNSEYVASTRRNLFQFRMGGQTGAMEIVVNYTTIDGVLTGTLVKCDLSDYAVELFDGKVMMAPNRFKAALTAELTQFLGDQNRRFEQITTLIPSIWIREAFWKSEAPDFRVASAAWYGCQTPYWFTTNSHFYIHQTEVGPRYFVTINGERGVAYSLGYHDNETDTQEFFNSVSETPAIPAELLKWFTAMCKCVELRKKRDHVSASSWLTRVLWRRFRA